MNDFIILQSTSLFCKIVYYWSKDLFRCFHFCVGQMLRKWNEEYCNYSLSCVVYMQWVNITCNELLLLRSEIPSGMCAKLRTVAASNNRVHMPWSLYYCLFAPHICAVLFFTHIPFVVNHTFSAKRPEKLQHYIFIQRDSLPGRLSLNFSLTNHIGQNKAFVNRRKRQGVWRR